jgi:hypothetical protein
VKLSQRLSQRWVESELHFLSHVFRDIGTTGITGVSHACGPPSARAYTLRPCGG